MLAKQITSLQHPKIAHWSQLVNSRDYREEMQSVFVTGKKLLQELEKKGKFKALLTTAESSPFSADELFLVTPEILKKITRLPSSDGLAAEVVLPPPQDLSKTSSLLVLDELSDPGNLGTLLRSAWSLGWEGVVMTPGTVDLFNDKALRAAKGATFFLPYQGVSREELLTWPHQKIVADAKGTPLSSSQWSSPFALILSHESKGATSWPHSTKVAIPMQKGTESLNVASAGAILLYQLRSHGAI